MILGLWVEKGKGNENVTKTIQERSNQIFWVYFWLVHRSHACSAVPIKSTLPSFMAVIVTSFVSLPQLPLPLLYFSLIICEKNKKCEWVGWMGNWYMNWSQLRREPESFIHLAYPKQWVSKKITAHIHTYIHTYPAASVWMWGIACHKWNFL